MCLNPSLIKNKRYLKNKKNKGKPPKCTDERKRYVPIGCGFCIECRKQKARNWQIRLSEELKYNTDAIFINLTLSDDSIAKLENDIMNNHQCAQSKLPKKQRTELIIDANIVATTAVRLFLERIRAELGHSIRHWLITELGQTNTERIHLHGILWHSNELKLEWVSNSIKPHYKSDWLQKKWQYGNIWIGDYCNAQTVNYMIKYVLKSDEIHKEFMPKVLPSPGIGKQYLNSYDAQKHKFNWNDFDQTNETYRLNNGKKVNLPIYYRNHLYTEAMREKLWTNLLDKETRYVMGHKIDVSTEEGQKEYEECCKYYSAIDNRNGNTSSKYKPKQEREKYKASKKIIGEITKNIKKQRSNPE